MEFSEFQHLTHLVGVSILVFLYLLRLVVLMRRRMVRDRSPDPREDIARGAVEALFTIIMPWKMESTRKHWTHYLEFVVFHIGVFATILVSFAITYASTFMAGPISNFFIFLIAAGLVAGAIRLVRRLYAPEMRIISTFDDYISISLVLLFEFTGILTLIGFYWASVAYFTLAAALLVYEPFSKLRHYIYYPFARFFYGSEFTKKGVLKQEIRSG